jgi:DNA-binding NtrC family response regulator
MPNFMIPADVVVHKAENRYSGGGRLGGSDMEQQSQRNQEGQGDGMRILLVDDEVELVATLAERLTLRGLQTDWAGSPADALNLAQQQRYDIAVLDMKMPKVNGRELMRIMQVQYPWMQFIFMSGQKIAAAWQDEPYGTDGKLCYLVKPVDIEVLIDTIHREATGSR